MKIILFVNNLGSGFKNKTMQLNVSSYVPGR